MTRNAVVKLIFCVMFAVCLICSNEVFGQTKELTKGIKGSKKAITESTDTGSEGCVPCSHENDDMDTERLSTNISDSQFEELRDLIIKDNGNLIARWGEEDCSQPWGNLGKDCPNCGDCKHTGVDFGTNGESVDFYAVADGVITETDSAIGMICLYSSIVDVTFIYLHASSINVEKDQPVTMGTVLGKTGNIGTYELKLHFEAQNGNKPEPACCFKNTINPYQAVRDVIHLSSEPPVLFSDNKHIDNFGVASKQSDNNIRAFSHFNIVKSLMSDQSAKDLISSGSCATPKEKTTYLDTDPFALVWFLFNNGVKEDVFKLEWYAPDGTLNGTLNLTLDAGKGCGWASMSLDGTGPTPLGQWNVQMFINDEFLFTETFTIESAPDLPQAQLEISFDPNPVFQSSDKDWYHEVFVEETNGVGVTITEFTIKYPDGDVQREDTNTFSSWFDECGDQSSGYIPGFDTACGEIKIFGGNNVGELIWTFFGIDDNNHDITGNGTILLETGELKPPTADFSAKPTFGNAPLTVQFTDESIGDIDTWLWDFGDGGTSNIQNPDHTYEIFDLYTVSLTVSGPGGADSETKNNLIRVDDVIKPVLVISSIEPSVKQIKDWGEEVTYKITVKDENGNPVSGVTIEGEDDLHSVFFQTTSKTGNDGITTYTTKVPDENDNGVYDITFTAFKTGFDDSENVIRQVEVKHVDDPDKNLLKMFAPILYFYGNPDFQNCSTEDANNNPNCPEQFYPVPIEAMLNESVLRTDVHVGLRINNPTLDDLEKKDFIDANLDLFNADPGLSTGSSVVPDPNRWESYTPTVYGRTIETFDKDENPAKVLQYWFFYVFNNFTYYQPNRNNIDKLKIQRHEGDWEMIQIILQRSNNDETNGTFKPTGATYSYHQGGIHYDWNNLEFENSDQDKTHPKVFVARGSHGNWGDNGDNNWEQERGKGIISCDDIFIDKTSDNGKILYPDSISNVDDKYELIDISEETKSDELWHWVKWKGRWGDIEGGITGVGTDGPVSPANIEYGGSPNRWNDPIGWDEDPQPGSYKICGATRITPATFYVFDEHGNLIKTIENSGHWPLEIITDQDCTFEIHPTQSGKIEFSISRYSRKDKKYTTVRFKNVYLSTRDKAILPFASWNPELQLTIERKVKSKGKILNEWIRPHVLDIRSKAEVEKERR